MAIGLIVDTLKSERRSAQDDIVKTATDLSLSFSLVVQSILSYPEFMDFLMDSGMGVL